MSCAVVPDDPDYEDRNGWAVQFVTEIGSPTERDDETKEAGSRFRYAAGGGAQEAGSRFRYAAGWGAQRENKAKKEQGGSEMVKRLTVIGVAIVLMMSVLTGCGEKYKTDGCFVYEVVTTENGEYLTEDEYYVRLRELSDYGKQQKYIIVPAELDGYPIKEIGKPHLLAGLFTEQWESEVLEKIYFQGRYETGPSPFLDNCSKLEKVFLIAGNFGELSFDKRSYFPHTESQVSSSSIDKLFANVTFRFNYEESANEGVWWIDDYDNEKIEVIPPSPEREGYEFGGWYKETACINAWNFETDIVPAKEYTEDGEYVYKETCLYAKWQKG